MLLFNRSIVESFLPPVTSVPVAHYTRIGTLAHFIPENTTGWGSAWATPIQFLNDRMELSLGLEIFQEIANRPPRSGQTVRAIIEDLLITNGRLETDAFQMSFSGNSDELGQWRGYAANGIGCSVITDAVAVHNVADVAGWILYKAHGQRAFAYKILRSLRNETDVDRIEQTIVAAASYLKHEGFSPEKEFRLLQFPTTGVKFRESGDRLVPYIDYLAGKHPLPIDRIVIGPGWQLSGLMNSDPAAFARHHVVQGIKRLLDARGLSNTDIKSSEIPYDPK